jgi:uncharacterized RDD family membrane protein YckC
MKTSKTWLILAALTALGGLATDPSPAAAPRAAAVPAPPAPVVAPSAPAVPASAADDSDNDVDVDEGRGDSVVAIGHDAELAEGAAVDAVVAIFGNATSAGTVGNSVVAILGNARATGPVGENVAAIVGNSYVNNTVGKDVVAVLGNIELGPQANVGGEIVSIGGVVTRDPSAVVSGNIESISFGPFGRLEGLREWVRHCFLLGRPLSLDPGVRWAWGVALAFLALYVLLALLFRDGLQRCVATFESRPGASMLAALAAILLTPILTVLLLVTVIGIIAIPFVGIALFCAALFGKAVMLAWMGRRVLRGSVHPALAVLVGGAITLALYVVPVLGIIVYKLLGVLGLGVVLYTLLLAVQSSRSAPVAAPAAAPAPEPLVSPAAAAAASIAAQPAPIDLASLPRAGFWPRMAGLLLDIILVGIVVSLISDVSRPRALLLCLAIYAAVMWHIKGTTIGGSVVNLKVVRLDGRPLDWSTACVRALGCFLSLAVAGLGFFWIAFSDDKQAWHDKIAGTAVVRVPKGVPLL